MWRARSSFGHEESRIQVAAWGSPYVEAQP